MMYGSNFKSLVGGNQFFDEEEVVTSADNDNFSWNKSSWNFANGNNTAANEPIGNMWDSFSSWFAATADDDGEGSLSSSSSSFSSAHNLTASSFTQEIEPMSLFSFFYNETFLNDEYSIESDLNDTYNCTAAWSNDTTFCPEEITVHRNYWALLLILFPLFTVFGNVLVILAVKRERSLQSVTNYFIVSLAVADLLVAIAVMPFGVYVLVNQHVWQLPLILCDVYMAMDVTCSTSSILHLVAIGIDRFIAVTQPIKYAKHKSNTRVWLTIVFVWTFSGLVGSPIVLGLNAPPPELEGALICAFHNKYFSLFSSLCSFYIPCAVLTFLYYRIFKVIRERAKKAVGTRKSVGSSNKGSTVIENIAQTKRLAETTLGVGPPVTDSSGALVISNRSNAVEDEKLTNTQSGSQEDGDMEDLDKDGDDEDGTPDSDDCHIIPNNQATTAFVLENVGRSDERSPVGRGVINGNHDSGYAASNMEEGPFPVAEGQLSPKQSLVVPDQCKRNGVPQNSTSGGDDSPSREGEEEGGERVGLGVGVGAEEASSSNTRTKTASRFTLGKVHKASRKKREKSSAKRERKATKTLAIVLGLFLACWLPFFTFNIMDAVCSLFIKRQDCEPGVTSFLLTTWFGYINSSLNPIVYTIFNTEFRKAFKKLMGMDP